MNFNKPMNNDRQGSRQSKEKTTVAQQVVTTDEVGITDEVLIETPLAIDGMESVSEPVIVAKLGEEDKKKLMATSSPCLEGTRALRHSDLINLIPSSTVVHSSFLTVISSLSVSPLIGMAADMSG